MAGLRVPIICVVIGEGASGGALAIGVGNRLLMLENSWYSVISPEGAAALLWKDASFAERAARTMKITAPDLLELGIIDDLIPEITGGAHHDLQEQAKRIDQFLIKHLDELSSYSKDELVLQRLEKYRNMGTYKIGSDYTE